MFLSLSKKAVTEADACHVLEQAYSLQRPFGVPTLILKPEHVHVRDDLPQEYLEFFASCPTNMMLCYGSKRRPLMDIFAEALQTFPEFSSAEADKIEAGLGNGLDTGLSLNYFVPGNYKTYSVYATATPAGAMPEAKDAHHYQESLYRPPAFNLITAPRERLSAGNVFTTCLNAKPYQVPASLPGYNSQYHFFVLVHEMGHGAGAGEAQTEMMAAIASRQVFADTRFISANADIRALSMLDYREAPSMPDYNWSIVEGLDRVIAMDQCIIDAMKEDDITTLRFETFPHAAAQWNSLLMVFDAAITHGGTNFLNAHKKKNLPALAHTLQNLQTTNLPENAKAIAARLSLAAERLSTPGAYKTNPSHPGPR